VSYQKALLDAIRQGATLLGFEEEPTWQTIGTDLMRQIDVAGLARRIAASTLSYAGIIVFMLLNTAFLLVEQRTFAAKIVSLAQSPAAAAQVASIIADVNRRVGTYLAMKTLMNAMIAGATYVVLRALGIEMAIFWAVFVGLVNYVPYFGSAVGVALPVLFALIQVPDKETVLWLFLLLTLSQFVVGSLIEPQVMGTSLNLSPWVILISLTIWGALWGVIGALFSVPITAVIVVICSEFSTTRPVAVLLSRDGRV
jgi:AI-2 transport protein TqsA